MGLAGARGVVGGWLTPVLAMTVAGILVASTVTQTVTKITAQASLGSRHNISLATQRSEALPVVLGVSADSGRGQATLRLPFFTSVARATTLGARYGMNLLAYYPTFGDYVFSLPRIRVTAGSEPNTAVVNFPPLSSSADMDAFLQSNGLTVQTWMSVDDASGRTAAVALP